MASTTVQHGQAEKPLSREEKLQLWREQRAAKQKSRDNKKNDMNSNHHCPHPNHRQQPTPEGLRKKVKVKVRRSNPTPEQPHMRVRKSAALRLYEQGTVASRLKSKVPVQVQPSASASMLVHPSKQYPSTLPKERKELQNGIVGSEHRRKSEPSHLAPPKQNDENKPNQKQSQQPRESFSSIRLMQESPIRRGVDDDDDSTNLLVIDYQQQQDEAGALSPLSCSFQSSTFGSPLTTTPARGRPRNYDLIEPKQLMSDDDDYENDNDKYFNNAPESLTKNSISPIDKETTANRHAKSSFVDDDDNDCDKENEDLSVAQNNDVLSIVDHNDDVENSPGDCACNVTSRSKSQRSSSIVLLVGNNSCSLSYGSDDCLDFENWDHLTSPAGMDLPGSPSQRRGEAASLGDHDHHPCNDLEQGTCSTATEEITSPVAKQEEPHIELEDSRGVDPPGDSATEELPEHSSDMEMKDDDDDLFDWRQNMTPDTPSPRNSLIGQIKRRMDARTLVLPDPSSTTEETPEQDESPKSDIRSQQSLSSSSLNSALEEENDNSQEDDHYRSATPVSSDRQVPSLKIDYHSSDMDVDEDTDESRLDDNDDDDSHSSVVSEARDDVDDCEEQRSLVCDRFFHAEGKTILQPVREQPIQKSHTREGGEAEYSCRRCKTKDLQIEALRYQMGELQWRTETAESDKQKYQNQIFAFRKKYESRVTPFRDLFEEVRLRTIFTLNCFYNVIVLILPFPFMIDGETPQGKPKAADREQADQGDAPMQYWRTPKTDDRSSHGRPE